MNFSQLSDKNLHLETQAIVGQERQILTKILHHLREIERRRLRYNLVTDSIRTCRKLQSYF
ncbi:MAG: hypothetical protein NT027_06930 [Proteobacteria bacterium]|nr:hypothetical protein [Pseudomonadota bacterium]